MSHDIGEARSRQDTSGNQRDATRYHESGCDVSGPTRRLGSAGDRLPGYVVLAVPAPLVFGCLGFFGVFAFLSIVDPPEGGW